MYQASEAHKAILDEILIQFCGYFWRCILAAVLLSVSLCQSFD